MRRDEPATAPVGVHAQRGELRRLSADRENRGLFPEDCGDLVLELRDDGAFPVGVRFGIRGKGLAQAAQLAGRIARAAAGEKAHRALLFDHPARLRRPFDNPSTSSG